MGVFYVFETVQMVPSTQRISFEVIMKLFQVENFKPKKKLFQYRISRILQPQK